jgi:prepilin-type N-terminal cleavage/methylation domain-containing protein
MGRGLAKQGYTLIEVMMAAVVLALGLVSALICIQIGVRDLDVARTGTAVSQALQNEMERLRLEDWTEISALPATESLNLGLTFSSISVLNRKVTFVREVKDVTGFADMKEIAVTARWTSIDGRPHSRTYRMRYAKNGLYDYYYSSNLGA